MTSGRNQKFRRAFGRWFSRMRRKRGWSVKQMSDYLGVDPSAVVDYEKDGYRAPSFDSLPVFLWAFESEFVAFLMGAFLKDARHPDDWRD